MNPADRPLPVIELHRHLEGAVRLTTMLELADRHGLRLPGRTVAELRPHVVITGSLGGLLDFLQRLQWMIHVLADVDACRRIAYESIEDAAREGIDYLELRFSPGFMARPHGLDATAVVAAVVDGARAGERAFGVRTNLIGIMSRTFGPDACREELEALLAHQDAIRALDLAGDEARWPGRHFHSHFRRGRDAGWQVTVHAGEAGGADNVRYAVEELGATRIGHGIKAAGDPELLRMLADRGIGLEINLTSNVQTATVPSLAAHPMRMFLDAGIRASLNTDDPVISGIDLEYEIAFAAPAAGLSPAHVRQARENALATAYLTPAERAELERRAAARIAGS
ncbi:MAG TPA: adenosine deaminase [Candidatus Didemnitutus sp.]|jgi:adenosine deaminase